MGTTKDIVIDPDTLDVQQAAALVGRHPETIRRWIGSGRLAGQRRGRRLLVTRADVTSLVGQANVASSLAEWAKATDALRGGPNKRSLLTASDLVITDRRENRSKVRRVLVVDASVVVDWVAPDIDPEAPALMLLRRLATAGTDLVAPRLLIEEVSNALLTGIRRGKWTGASADQSIAVLRRLPVRLVDEPRDVERAWDLARRYDNHPIYDMLFVAVAERRGLRLVTADTALRSVLRQFDWIVGPDGVLPEALPR